jgi:3-isopropylmalate/(R)-2-methylmalate dehydratase small subunit
MASTITAINGRAVPVVGNDIDTDRIIPARFLRCVTFDGLGEHAFEDDRAQLQAAGKQHSFDDARYAGATVLVVNANFGCGSSREHAPQAIAKWGIKAIVGVSFAEIFFGNCVAMGVPCLTLAPADAEALQKAIAADPALAVTVDIATAQVRAGTATYPARIPPGPQRMFTTGAWDATGELLDGLDQVRAVASRLAYTRAYA